MSFNGFNEYTNEYLVGIKFNNNKPWFQTHKDMYTENVHNITVEFADALLAKIVDFDPEFTEKPKISRANRDIRFSKNKAPYKLCKWFFFKNPLTKGSMPHNAPGFFFEMSADWWRYGLFFGDNPQTMALLRAKINADPASCSRIVSIGNKSRFDIEGEDYKRIFNKDLSDNVNLLAQKKWITYVRYEDYDNMDFYSSRLVDTVFEGFKEIYEVYKYLKVY